MKKIDIAVILILSLLFVWKPQARADARYPSTIYTLMNRSNLVLAGNVSNIQTTMVNATPYVEVEIEVIDVAYNGLPYEWTAGSADVLIPMFSHSRVTLSLGEKVIVFLEYDQPVIGKGVIVGGPNGVMQFPENHFSFAFLVVSRYAEIMEYRPSEQPEQYRFHLTYEIESQFPIFKTNAALELLQIPGVLPLLTPNDIDILIESVDYTMDFRVRDALATVLGRLKISEAARPIVDSVDRIDGPVAQAALALQEINHPQTFEYIEHHMFNMCYRKCRIRLITLLGNLRLPESLTILSRFASEDQNPEVRNRAARILTEYQEFEARLAVRRYRCRR
jgi:hypothetical protein